MTYEVEPIGFVRSTRAVVADDKWDRETASIELDQTFSSDALLGLESFSHVEVVYLLDQVKEAKIETAARHPRGDRRWPRVGIFAQRAPTQRRRREY